MAASRSTSACKVRRTCRVCGSLRREPVVNLGRSPPANAFLKPADLARPEPRYPLEVVRCLECGLVQLRHVVDRSLLFRHYVYFSSASGPMADHFAQLARSAADEYGGSRPGLAVEIGSNDGTLLRALRGSNLDVLGIEPARNIARYANDQGIRTWNTFFGREVARRIRSRMGPARIVFSNNVLAHIDDLHEAAGAVADLLEPEGVWIIEVPHLAQMIERVEFDTIYHEHLSYFSLPPIERLLKAHGMSVEQVEEIPVHGGSLRIFVRSAALSSRQAPNVAKVRSEERRIGLHRASTFRRFRVAMEGVRSSLPRLLDRLRSKGKKIVGYGAPAKGNTLLNYCGIDRRRLDFLLDTTPAKQGLFAPGSRLEVRPPAAFRSARPDYALLLAWNFETEILERERDYVAQGGRFIRPIPFPEVIEPGPAARFEVVEASSRGRAR